MGFAQICSPNPLEYKPADLNFMGRTPSVPLGLDLSGVIAAAGHDVRSVTAPSKSATGSTFPAPGVASVISSCKWRRVSWGPDRSSAALRHCSQLHWPRSPAALERRRGWSNFGIAAADHVAAYPAATKLRHSATDAGVLVIRRPKDGQGGW